MRVHDKRILKNQVDSILYSAGGRGSKSIQKLDSVVSNHIASDLKLLSRENDNLQRELDELDHFK